MKDRAALKALLRKVEAFKDLEEESIDWLLEKGHCQVLARGKTMFDKGDAVNEMHVLLEGRVRVHVDLNGQLRELTSLESGEITGILPYSRLKATIGKGVAIEETHVLSLPKEHFPEMIREHQDLVQNLVHIMMNRVRDFTSVERQTEKMAALGKLSAGLAHELNNPAAAILRSSLALKEHLGHVPEKFKKVINIQVSEEVVDFVNDLIREKIGALENLHLSLMEKTEREEDIQDWLEDQGLEDCGDEVVETFTECGFEVEDLEALASKLRGEDLSSVLQWIESNLATEKIVSEIQEASDRISNLVSSVKSYTHMDQNPEKKAIDIRVGIQNTLKILAHKARKNQIEVEMDISDDFPHVPILVSEMNQVWTNLIDNSIDALENAENRSLKIWAKEEEGFAKIYFEDQGPGVPEEIQTRIFEPFFTTKSQGKGTGIGLDTVFQIMRQHNGKISLVSSQNPTIFEVCLPLRA